MLCTLPGPMPLGCHHSSWLTHVCTWLWNKGMRVMMLALVFWVLVGFLLAVVITFLLTVSSEEPSVPTLPAYRSYSTAVLDLWQLCAPGAPACTSYSLSGGPAASSFRVWLRTSSRDLWCPWGMLFHSLVLHFINKSCLSLMNSLGNLIRAWWASCSVASAISYSDSLLSLVLVGHHQLMFSVTAVQHFGDVFVWRCDWTLCRLLAACPCRVASRCMAF